MNVQVNIPTVQNMQSSRGNDVPNQFELLNVTIKYKGKNYTGRVFQSYSTIIAFQSSTLTLLDESAWDYSRTTSKYRNEFLRQTTQETIKAISTGTIKLVNLN